MEFNHYIPGDLVEIKSLCFNIQKNSVYQMLQKEISNKHMVLWVRQFRKPSPRKITMFIGGMN